MESLRQLLKQIDGRSYKAYKQLRGSYNFNSYQLSIDHVQGDPFALPSRISIQIKADTHCIPQNFWSSKTRQTALEDYLGRKVAEAIQQHVKNRRGTGRSGEISISANQQQVLRRNAVLIAGGSLDVRMLFALPGSGRSILSTEAAVMFFDELPKIVQDALLWSDRSQQQMLHHIEQIEDQQALRDQLKEENAVAFVADGSILPRRSGIDDQPLTEGLPFESPATLKHEFILPHQGKLTGMLIPQGVTLIVGGGYHGKSTLLQALERCVYNHIPGDGRELVATLPSAVKIRAEDHRSVQNVDISPFIGTLPGNRPTDCFSTENASGSTSQATNIIEALETGCECLLIDEDTSATNFMIRDERMQQLVPDSQEPITPLLHRVRQLYEKEGVSTVIVTGGSGDYLTVADTVIMLDNYQPVDVTDKAKSIAGTLPPNISTATFKSSRKRQIDLSTKAFRGQREVKIQVREQRFLDYGRRRIDLSCVEQLLDAGQTEAIGFLLAYAHKLDPGQDKGLVTNLKNALAEVEKQGLDLLLPWKAGHLAMPRLHELLAAANRLRQA